jgi:alcohol dehydrogenase (cytochrome c)
MKRLLIAVALLAGCTTTADQAQVETKSRLGAGPTQEEISNAGRQTDNVLTYGLTYDHNRYSPLKQINKSNVKRLVPVWNVSLQNDLGEQAQPMIYDGVMFVSNARWTYAIDALTGKVIWRTAVDYDPGTPSVVCCGVSNKGVAIFEGKVFRTTLDAHVVALDGRSGRQLWQVDVLTGPDGRTESVGCVPSDSFCRRTLGRVIPLPK